MASPLPIDDPQRLAALAQTGLMDSPPEARFDRITQLVVDRLGASQALLSFVDAERQFFKSAIGLAEPLASARQTPLSHSMCKYVVKHGTPLAISDLAAHPYARESPSIETSGIVSYIGVPVEVDGMIIGSLCAIDGCRREWKAEDTATLAELAAVVSAEIAKRPT
ncbi:MAG: GAF domain-containing protein [Kofleriaceae bacterium]|nr:GAF domain-containing protein [Kofleriaceae bacterium]